MKIKIVATPNPKYAYTNRVYVTASTFETFSQKAEIKGVKISKTDPTVNISVAGQDLIFQAS